MKIKLTIIVAIICFSINGCSKDGCNQEELARQYQDALSRCNGSVVCAKEMYRQYQERLKNCD